MSTTPPQEPWGQPPGEEPSRGEGPPPGYPPSPPPGPDAGGYPPPPPPPPGGGGYPSPPAGGNYPPPPPPDAGNYPPPPNSWNQAAGWQQPGPGGDWGSPSAGRGGYLAGWWRRVGATILDGVLVGVVSAIVLGIAGVPAVGRSILEIVIQGAYLIIMIGGFGGRTIGNRAVSTRTVDARTGEPAGYDRAVPRTLVELLLSITIIGGILDILWPLWDDQNRTLHDKAAGTVVLRNDL